MLRDVRTDLLRNRTFTQHKTDMKKHEILSPQSRAALFDPPTDPASIVRHYTLSPDDMALIRDRRRAANRLGFAIQLAYFRHPGRIMRVDEEPPEDMLAFIAGQVHAGVDDFRDYWSCSNTTRTSRRFAGLIEYQTRPASRRAPALHGGAERSDRLGSR